MKKLFLIFAFILVPYLCFAGAIQQMQSAVVAKKRAAGGASCEAGSEELLLNAHVSGDDLDENNACTGDATQNHLCVDETYASPNTGDVLNANGLNETVLTERFALADTSSMGADCETVKIEVFIYADDNAYPAYLDVALYINAGLEASAEGDQEMGASYAWYTWTFTGTWTKAQVDAAQIDVTIEDIDREESHSTDMATIVAKVTYE